MSNTLTAWAMTVASYNAISPPLARAGVVGVVIIIGSLRV